MTCGIRRSLLELFLGAGLLACRPPPALGQTSACLTTEPRATSFLGSVRHWYGLVGADSSQWKANGFPFATGSAITLVTDTATCSLAVTAYNQASGRAGTARAVTQVYVAKVGSTGYVVTTTQGATGEWTSYLTFDKRWRSKDGKVAIQG